MFTCVPPRERGKIEEDSSLPFVSKLHEVPQARLIRMVMKTGPVVTNYPMREAPR